MKLLAIDTATEACSVAVGIDGAICERWREAPREHGDLVLGMVDEVLAEAGLDATGLDALVLGRGPGAFTGVRMAAGVVQGIAFGLDRPVLRVSTLAALAQGGYRRTGEHAWLPAIDARMREVYWGGYQVDDAGVARLVIAETVSVPTAVEVPTTGAWHGIGSGWGTYAEILAEQVGARLARNLGHALPSARDLLPAAVRAWEQGEAVAADQALPVYLRDRVAEPARGR